MRADTVSLFALHVGMTVKDSPAPTHHPFQLAASSLLCRVVSLHSLTATIRLVNVHHQAML